MNAACKFKILIVDDSEALAQTLGYMVEILGHTIKLAHDGATALSVAQSFLPDVIFLDISLPEMDGYEVCKKLRAIPALTECVFIAQTGWGQAEYKIRSMEAGFDHHVVKPISFEAMEKLLLSLRETVDAA